MSQIKYAKSRRFLEVQCERRGFGIKYDSLRSVTTISSPSRSRVETVNGRKLLWTEQGREIELTDFDLFDRSRRAINRQLDRLGGAA